MRGSTGRSIGSKERLNRFVCDVLANGVDAQALEGLAGPDGPRIIALATEERVGPLLCAALAAAGVERELPEETQAFLRSIRLDAAVSYLALRRELRVLLPALAEHPGVPAVLLKGSALALAYYPQPALRPMADIDVLVPEARLPEAYARLERAGFQNADDRYPGLTDGVPIPTPHHVMFGRPRVGAPVVEVHETLMPGMKGAPPAHLEWFWLRTETVSLPRDERAEEFPGALQLDPTATLLYLAAHCTLAHRPKTGSINLLWLHDVHLVLARRGEEIDPEALWRHASVLCWDAGLREALVQVQDCFGSERAGELVRSGQATSLAGGAPAWAAAQAQRTTSFSQGLKGIPPGDRLRYLVGVILPKPAFVRWRYRPRPVWLWPAYYVYRWFELAYTVVGAGVATLFRPREPRQRDR